MLRWQTPWLLLLLLSIATPLAQADATLLEQRLQIGTPPREVAMKVSSAADVQLTLAGKRHVLATQNVTSASVEVVVLSERASLAVVRLRSEQAEWALLVGGKRGTDLLALERSDLHGDPGERRAFVVEVSAADAAARRTVTVGMRHEGLSLCSERAALTERRAVDEASLTLVPSTLPLPADAPTVSAAVAPENARPLVPLLTVQGSSVIDENTKQPVPARALLDGRGDTPWTAPPFSFATFRGTIPALPLERVDLALEATAGAGVQAPVELWLLGEGAKSVRVAVQPGAKAVSVPLEPAWSSRCLAVVLGPGAQAQKPVSLGEISAFGSVDRSGGTDALVGQVVRDGAEAQVAGEVLAALGVVGARALAARFDELPLRQKRRALALFARALGDDAVRARMLEAARSSEKELAEPALHLLSNAGVAGKVALRELARDASSAGDSAAKLLARDPGEANALLAAISEGDNAARPELRRAISFHGQRHAPALTTAIDAWLAQKPSVRAKLGTALALARVEALAPKVAELVALSLPEAQEFEDRYRLALTSPYAGASPALDAWVEQQALHADEWMMRHAAFSALDARLPARSGELAPALARDAYPRVRALALGTFSRTARWAELEQAAKGDAWPLVRTAAVKGLTPHPESGPALAVALEDTSRMVRAAAVDALAAQKSTSAWPAVKARLTAEGEWPVVRIAAVRFAAALCRQDAHDDLLALARQVARPDAAERDQELGLEALKAMNALGGKPAADAKQIAARDGVPPGLKRALEEAGGPSCVAAPVPQS